jgi:alkanesulfonate monooxygenase SsuD/methylene tetrahydromethanopterin reductase-like flavin-dependent oxidoreductase (luciferase family)
VGSYVLSVPNRTPGLVAWESATLDGLSGGRFELGVGGGRPGADRDAATLGRSFGTPKERLALVGETVRAVRAKSPAVRVLVAASGPAMVRLAAELADGIALGVAPQTGEPGLREVVDRIRAAAGARFDDVELNQNLLGVAGVLPPWITRQMGMSAEVLATAGSAAVLDGSVQDMCDTLRRRRDELGISYVCVSSFHTDVFAPVVECLAGT